MHISRCFIVGAAVIGGAQHSRSQRDVAAVGLRMNAYFPRPYLVGGHQHCRQRTHRRPELRLAYRHFEQRLFRAIRVDSVAWAEHHAFDPAVRPYRVYRLPARHPGPLQRMATILVATHAFYTQPLWTVRVDTRTVFRSSVFSWWGDSAVYDTRYLPLPYSFKRVSNEASISEISH